MIQWPPLNNTTFGPGSSGFIIRLVSLTGVRHEARVYCRNQSGPTRSILIERLVLLGGGSFIQSINDCHRFFCFRFFLFPIFLFLFFLFPIFLFPFFLFPIFLFPFFPEAASQKSEEDASSNIFTSATDLVINVVKKVLRVKGSDDESEKAANGRSLKICLAQ